MVCVWRLVVVAALLSKTASADVMLIDPTIEVSGQYMSAAAKPFGARQSLVGTGIHVVDRNGIYTAIVSALAGSRCTGDSCKQTIGWTSVEDHGSYLILRPESYTTQEESLEARNARRAAGDAIGFGSSTYTELAVWIPQGDTSNVNGGLFAMGAALVGNGKFALDIGLRWSDMRAEVCGTVDDPARCRHRFFGVPLRFIMKVGMFGAEVEGAYNFRVDGSLVRAGISLDVIDRLFVRAGAFSRISDIAEIGYTVDVGGRL